MRRLWLVGLATVTACGPSIRITLDPSRPIAPASSYAWGRADGPYSPAERDPRASDPALRTLIERAIDAELVAKGFRRTPTDSATLLVHYHLGVLTVVDTLRESPDDCGSPPCRATDWGRWGRPERGGREVTYTDGTLLVDVLDRASGVLIWRGVAEGDATPSKTAAERERRVTTGVARLLKRFPGR